MSETIEALISEEEIHDRIKEMAEVINRKYVGKELFIVGILNGSVFFLTELARHLTMPVEIDFMAVSSYGAGKASSGNIVVTKDLTRSITNKHVIIVEDIIDSGRTLNMLVKMLGALEPASMEVAALLDKPERRTVEFKADYVGFQIPDVFVVGWGMDYDQKYRDLAFIGVIEELD